MLKINKQSVDGLFPNKKEGYFELKSEYCPSGDQQQAISELINGINKKEKNQVLLGVTGSGKTEIYLHLAKQYLKESGLNTSEKAVREYVFDIEQARVACKFFGLKDQEDDLKEKNIGYTEGFVNDAVTLLREAKTDLAKFN